MERWAPAASLVLLWGCMLGAAAAEGKEGECVRGGRPGPPSPGGRTPDSRAFRSLARPWRAQLWKPTWHRPARACWDRRTRAGCDWDESGTPRLGLRGCRDSGWQPRRAGGS